MSSSTLPEVAFELLIDGRPSNWSVHRLHVVEALNDLPVMTLDVANEDLTADPDDLLDARGLLEIRRGDLVERRYGEVRRVERLGVTNTRRLARLVLGPTLQRLSQSSDARVFQDLSAPEIVSTVLDAHHVYQRTLVLDLERDCPPREYCVQYHESDLAFVMRLLEEEGITLYFRDDEHEDGEQLVLTDHRRSMRSVATIDGAAAPVAGPESATLHVESVRFFDRAIETRTSGTALRDFDWTRPSLDMTHASPQDAGSRASYEYPAELTIGGYQAPSYGHDDRVDQSRLRQEARLATAKSATARTNLIGAKPGAVLEITGHGDAGHDGKYLVLRVEHTGVAPEVIAGKTQHDQGEEERYRNELWCVPVDVPYRPERRTQKPRVLGMQTATVVGPGNEEIYTDEHGRVKVRFHWDREDNQEKSSCWIRVMQTSAGPGWGTFFVPRVGTEVVVNFLDGNPDRPLVIGCVYNGVNRPPYALPGEKTKSTIKTSSSPGGQGGNEIRLEDLKGSEEVYLHAQKDMNEVVENDHTTMVRGNQTHEVKGNVKKKVGGNAIKTVTGTQTTIIGKHVDQVYKASFGTHVMGDVEQTYDANLKSTIGKGETRTVLAGGQTVTVADGQSLTVAGGQTVTVAGGQNVHITGDTSITNRGSYTQYITEGGKTVSPAGYTFDSPAGFTVRADQINLIAPKKMVHVDPLKLMITGHSSELVHSKVTVGGSKLDLFMVSAASSFLKFDMCAVKLENHPIFKHSYGTQVEKTGIKIEVNVTAVINNTIYLIG